MKVKLIITVLMCFLNIFKAQEKENNFLSKNTFEKGDSHRLSSPTDGRISLRLAGNGSYMTILLGFIPEGTVNFDEGYDGHFINDGAAVEFYSLLGTTRLSIQALPELNMTNVSVPLGYELTTDDAYTISIDAEFIDPNFDIILEDTYQNTFTDLRQISYSFSGEIGEVHNRFKINFDNRSTLDDHQIEENTQNAHVFFSSNKLHIQTYRKDLQRIELFTITGKSLLKTKFTKNVHINNLSSGVYIVLLTTDSGEKMIKKLIKYTN